MSKPVKNLLIDDLRSRLQGVNDCLLVNVIGLNSEKTSKLRSELRKKNIHLQVIKNSMAQSRDRRHSDWRRRSRGWKERWRLSGEAKTSSRWPRK